ncbi:MAG: hypothetical protein QW767_02535 [Thermoprotei archaeon]
MEKRLSMSTVPSDVFQNPLDFRVFVLVIFLGMLAGLFYDSLAGGKLAFFRQERSWRQTMFGGKTEITNGKLSVVAKSVATDVAGAAPLLSCGSRYTRWLSHVLMEWGFIITVVYTVVRFFAYPGFAPFALSAPGQVALTLGYILMLAGCVMFLFQRVNVSKEGKRLFTYSAGDRFAFGVFAYSLTGLVYESVYTTTATAFMYFWLALYLLATAYLFLTVPWTKFSHMFYKAVYNVQHRLDAGSGLVHTPRPSEKVYVKEAN